jgi:RsiW-degrading membrane proteinase PrsW (M82 family)
VDPLALLGIGLFTATVGILFLFIVQHIAAWTEGRWLIGRSIVVLIFYIAKFIGFSYRSALDPDTNFILSFLGFTFGVGLCEELCKAVPLLWHFRQARTTLTWRGAFLWGLASGAAFGIAEGIIYAGSFYNGIAPVSTYLVRFISCVALHAVWTGSVGITLFKCQELIQQELAWYEFFPPLLRVLGVAMVLHGLYDTLLKKDLHALALVTAVASFAWLAWQVGTIGREEEASPAASPA